MLLLLIGRQTSCCRETLCKNTFDDPCSPVFSFVRSLFPILFDCSLKKSAYAQLMLHPDGEAWREEIQQRTREAIEQSNGGTDSIEEITLDELSETITKHGVRGIPASIREEYMSKIREACRVYDTMR